MLALPVISIDAVEAIMVYLFVYLFMNLGAFFIVITVVCHDRRYRCCRPRSGPARGPPVRRGTAS